MRTEIARPRRHPTATAPLKALLFTTALSCVLAPAPASAQTYDIQGQLVPRNPMRAAHDSLLAISVRRLAPGIYAAKNRFVWNGWVELPDGILVIDGGYDAPSAKALADTIRARSGPKPFRYLVVTSAQVDHMGGVRTFAALGATIVAQAGAADAVRDSLPMGAGGIAADSIAPSKPARARRTGGTQAPPRKAFLVVDRRLKLGSQSRPVVIEWAGRPACTGGDLYVYLPRQRVMFTGDLAWNGSVPWLVDPDFDRLGWIATLDTLLLKRFDVDSLVPGHGRLGPKMQGLLFTRNYLLDAWGLASKEAAWGVPVKDVEQWGDLGAYEDMEFYDPVHFVNMRRLYLESKGIKTPGRGRPGVIKPRIP